MIAGTLLVLYWKSNGVIACWILMSWVLMVVLSSTAPKSIHCEVTFGRHFKDAI
jgi:hypothetical protein